MLVVFFVFGAMVLGAICIMSVLYCMLRHINSVLFRVCYSEVDWSWCTGLSGFSLFRDCGTTPPSWESVHPLTRGYNLSVSVVFGEKAGLGQAWLKCTENCFDMFCSNGICFLSDICAWECFFFFFFAYMLALVALV